MVILAIDPGTTESAVVLWDGSRVMAHEIQKNNEVLAFIDTRSFDICACERLACYGMRIGRETLETAEFSGRCWERCESRFGRWQWVYRLDVKMHLCQSPRAKDGNVRQALIDKLGAPGTVKQPGVTYGIHTHEWSALAIAVFAHETFSK